MDIKILNIDSPLWLSTLKKVRHDVYHLPQYLYLESLRVKAIPEACLIEEDEKVFFLPYLLRKYDIVNSNYTTLEIFDVVSPYGYSGILINEAAASSPEFIDQAINSFQSLLQSKGVCSAFFRLHPIINKSLTKICSPDIFTPNGQTVSIDLTLSEPELWAHTRKGHQSTINKCKRLGFTAKIVKFKEYFDVFTAIYEETMNRVKAQQSYYFDNSYFTQLFNLGDKLHLCVVEFEEQIICTSLFFECCGIVQAHLGGTKNEFIKLSPFNLLLHHVRLWAKERGNKFLHIGGGVGGSTADSLYTFKSGFSRQRHDFLTMRLIIDEAKYDYLVELRAKALNTQTQNLYQSAFFPAYRADWSEKDTQVKALINN